MRKQDKEGGKREGRREGGKEGGTGRGGEGARKEGREGGARPLYLGLVLVRSAHGDGDEGEQVGMFTAPGQPLRRKGGRVDGTGGREGRREGRREGGREGGREESARVYLLDGIVLVNAGDDSVLA
jgi:hypothetical protein